MKNVLEKLILGTLLGMSSAAQAVPFTFEFNIPNWTDTNNVALYGTHGILDVTLDNGSSSILNQTYLNSEITNISLNAVGGTVSRSWTGAEGTGAASESYISTDGSGIPTLDLLAIPPNQTSTHYFFFDSPFSFQLGVINTDGGFTTFFIDDFQTFAETVPFDPNVNEFLGFSVIGQQINVPEPATLALLGLAFAGIGLARRREPN